MPNKKKQTQEQKPKLGRPPRAGEAAPHKPTVRFTDAEFATFCEAAADAGMSLAEWIRESCELRVTKERR